MRNKAHLLFMMMVWITTLHGQSALNNQNNRNMTQQNKDVIRKIYEEALNKRKMELLNEWISPDFTGIRGAKGVTAFQEPVTGLIKSFPDIQWKVEELIGESDKVMVRWTWKGTQQSTYTFIANTNKTITNVGIGVFQLKEGKVISSQVLTDRLAFLQELEVLPSDIATIPDLKIPEEAVQFVDKFILPAAAKEEIMQRMNYNRKFLRTLPGFIKDEAFERKDEQGNTVLLTVATWASEQAMAKAKEAVQIEYKRIGFNPNELFQRHNIKLERDIYHPVVE